MPVTAATNANVIMVESLTGHSSCYQNGEKGFQRCSLSAVPGTAGRVAQRLQGTGSGIAGACPAIPKFALPLRSLPARSLAGGSARRQATALESHFDHPANALISALHEAANPTMYVTQLSVASTHPTYMSLKDETRGGADSIRAAN